MDETNIQEKLSTLRGLDRRRGKIELRIKDIRKSWSLKIAEGRANLKAVIETDNPQTVVGCEERLNSIRLMLEEVEDDEAMKKKAVTELSDYMKKVQNAIFEIIRSEPSDQIDLDLGSSPLGNAIRVSEDSAEVINSLGDDDGFDIDAEIQAMGVGGLSLVADPTIEQPEDEDEEELAF